MDPTTPSTDPVATYWSRTGAELFAALRSGPQGLPAAEAARRLARDGPNAIDEEPAVGIARLLLRQFESPLVLILVFAALVALLLGEWIESLIILAIVLGSTALGFAAGISRLQRRGKAARAARAEGARAARRRRRAPCQSPNRAGDVVVLSAGNLVPADGSCSRPRDFLVSEASLTGESFPVEKQPGVVPAGTPLARRSNCVLPGHLGAQRHRHGVDTCTPAATLPWRGMRAGCEPRRRRPNSHAACGSSASCWCA